jgi:uncharacterized membrane protein YebE (DUF533 family)
MTAKDSVTARWMFADYWSAPPDLALSDQENLDYGKALIIAANGDGRLTEAEKEWIIGYGATSGYSEETLAALRAFEGRGDIESLFTTGLLTTEPARRIMVFDAIRAAGSDGELADDEIATIRAVAQRLAVPDDQVDELLSLYRAEQEVKARRVRTMFPEGYPV